MNYKSQIKTSEEILFRLYKRFKSTVEHRDSSKEAEQEWSKALTLFNEKYRQLSFLNGTTNYRLELRAGNKEAIEYAICFLEVRPYYHRSGYMWIDLLRVLKNCNLSKTQRKRYETVRQRYKAFKAERKKL